MSARGGVFYAIKLIQDSFTTASLLAATCFSWAGVRWICSGIGLTRHQKDRQVANIQTDKVLSRGCLKFEAGVFDPNNSALALKLDYVPLWLAKIAITPKMERETPELAARLEQYQLRAKDVLAAAFLPQEVWMPSLLYPPKASSLGEIARYLGIMVKTMEKNDQPPEAISRAFETVSVQFGIVLPVDFVKASPFQQLTIC